MDQFLDPRYKIPEDTRVKDVQIYVQKAQNLADLAGGDVVFYYRPGRIHTGYASEFLDLTQQFAKGKNGAIPMLEARATFAQAKEFLRRRDRLAAKEEAESQPWAGKLADDLPPLPAQ